MLQIRRNTARLLRRSSRQQPRSYSSSSTSSHPPPANETLGARFFIAIGSVPVVLAVYKYSLPSNSSADFSSSDVSSLPLITRWIRYFDSLEQRNIEVNTLHTAILEQAAQDRNLFVSDSPVTPRINLRFPEVFNTGSPYNVPAGHGANLSAIQEHYRKKHAQADEDMARKSTQEKK